MKVQTKRPEQIQVTIHPQQEKRSKEAGSWVMQPEHYPLRKAEKSLDKLIGMKKIKSFVRQIYAFVYVNQCRKELSLPVSEQNLHMLFIGNPGTGKTTVARILAQMFQEMNVLPKGHLIEAERADLVGEYIGQTAQKTRDLIKKAAGGILFIDEAYSLSRGGEKDFGREAVDTLVKAMEDHKHQFILILAGYPEEMQRFLRLNPGLPSRFPHRFHFDDFSPAELLEIFLRQADELGYVCTPTLKKTIKEHLEELNEQERRSHNGRYVRNLMERMLRMQALRLLEENTLDDESLMTFTHVDFEKSTLS
ncbi:AAA family ATPase [Aliibacillus thermotolerans]|uniref:AAA family ATPase n=1 Tax=Aliibacillus thermotolerans TaxID=1834418 RepID=A0ABW0U7B1_9BACI|nr:AAA family ATPase [Aliibacillus thermotolerans]MDA3130532.1 AAA family ATPase [Aliibacillus thermotolerans]